MNPQKELLWGLWVEASSKFATAPTSTPATPLRGGLSVGRFPVGVTGLKRTIGFPLKGSLKGSIRYL